MRKKEEKRDNAVGKQVPTGSKARHTWWIRHGTVIREHLHFSPFHVKLQTPAQLKWCPRWRGRGLFLRLFYITSKLMIYIYKLMKKTHTAWSLQVKWTTKSFYIKSFISLLILLHYWMGIVHLSPPTDSEREYHILLYVSKQHFSPYCI